MRRVAATTAFVVGATLVSAVPASAEDVPYNYEAAREWTAWKVAEGTPSIARAATEALLGTDEDIRAFEQGGGADEAQAADNRAAAEALAGMDGPAVKAAAMTALAGTPEDVEAFISIGFQTAWLADERLRVYRVMEGAGPTTKAAAQAALNGTADDVTKFLSENQAKSEYADDRLAATRMLTGGVNSSGPALNAAAVQALAGTAADLRYFLVRGQHVARARDAEMASITKLTQQAKDAGETTSREALAASDTSRRAQNSAEAAKKAAQEAAAEAKAAGGSAKKASAAAGRAADAAQGAAKAAKEAKGAASAAMRAASVAEDAARRATTAASLTAQAASNAHSAAAAARSDKNKAADARKAAEKARDAAAAALELEKTRAERDRALAQAQEAVSAWKSSKANADAAADAADEASGQAGVSAEQAKRARDAAAAARREAAAAARAADRALTFAKAAAKASDQAFQFAKDAAAHATAAAAAADDAADHAGDASKAATESAKHAQAAVASADLAARAANQAVELEKLSREQDTLRLTEATEQGIEESQEAAAAHQAHNAAGGELVAWNRELLWDTEEEDRVNPSTRTLLDAATVPGASADVIRDNGRRAALELMQTGGQWTREAAQAAVAGTDVELQAWLSHGRLVAVGQDNRARLWSLNDKLAAGAEKTAAQAALDGDDAAVQKFLRTRNYAGKIAKDRTAAYAIQATAGPNLKAAVDRALAGTSADLHQFLRTGQHTARAADERIEAYRVMESGGPEVKATAQVALAGPASYVSYFLTTSRYQAAQRDNEQASHVAAIGKMILEAQSYAEKARSDANEALRVAALARKAEAEAINYANQAAASRTKADNYAQQAAASAAAAKKSADAAAQSATEAQQAAASAKASADKAARSAAVATAAADRAASDAAGAQRAAAQAKADAKAAGKDAKAAQAAADDAVLIYNEKLKAYEEQRRSEEAGSGSGGTGTAGNDHKTWSCLLPDQMSKECAQVYVSFADALLRPQQCSAVTARDTDTGCEMLGDIMDFAKDNPDLLLDALQFVLMACGMAPGVGEACDVIDAGVSLARGDYAGAALSGVSMIPFAGYVGTFFKGKRMSGKFRKALDVFEELAEKCDNVPNAPGVARFGNSFVPGTPVLLADGKRKPIEQVRVGDRVLATDPATGRTGARIVTATVGGAVATKQLVDITVDTDGDTGTDTAVISATAHHSFWAPHLRAWVSASALATGTKVQNAEGELVEIEGVQRRTITGAAYNFTVDGFHTYYVGAGEQSVLVHNCGKIDIDQGIFGAHPKDHVNKSDADLLDRARNDPSAGGRASALNGDAAQGQAVVDAVVAANRKKIDDWMAKHQNGEEYDLDHVADDVIGRIIYADGSKVESKKVRLVLKKIGKGTVPGHKGSWILKTIKVTE